MNKKFILPIVITTLISAIWLITYGVFAWSSDPNDIISINNVNYGADFTDGSWTLHTKWESYTGPSKFQITFSWNKEDNSAKTCTENTQLNVINGLTSYDKSLSTCVFDEFKQNSMITVAIKLDLTWNNLFTDTADYAYTYQYQFASYYTKTYVDNRNIKKAGFIDDGSMWNTGKILDSKLPF